MTALNKQALKPGLYAILFCNNWDGEGDTYETLASLDSNLIWHNHETGKELFEFEGDAVLKAWPLDDGSNVLALLDENLQLQRDKDSLEAVAIAMRDDMREAHGKLEAAEKRIAELEARTVTLPQYRNSPDMHTKQFYEAIGFNQGLDIFIEALRAAGIGVKGE